MSNPDAEKFVQMCHVLASKTVLNALIIAICSATADTTAADTTVEKIRALINVPQVGYMSMDFDDLDAKLNVSLSIVDKDYVCEVMVPSEEYAKDLYMQYNALKNIACTWWKQWRENNPELIAEIGALVPDMVDLTVDPASPTTLYFLPSAPKRVGIFCYYVDRDGNPLKRADSN